MSTTKPRPALTATEIAQALHAQLLGNPDVEIDDVQILERATARDLTFVGNQKNLSRLKQSAARLIIVVMNCPQLTIEPLCWYQRLNPHF